MRLLPVLDEIVPTPSLPTAAKVPPGNLRRAVATLSWPIENLRTNAHAEHTGRKVMYAFNRRWPGTGRPWRYPKRCPSAR